MAITVVPLSEAIEYFLRVAAQPNPESPLSSLTLILISLTMAVAAAPRWRIPIPTRKSVLDEAPAARRRGGDELHSLFSEAFDPAMGLSRSLSQVLGWVDQMNADNSSTKVPMVVYHCGWRVKEEKDALYLSVGMPGLGVHLSFDQNTLLLKGHGDKESDEEEIDHVPMEQYKVDQIRAEMKNCVLKVVLPKVMEEDHKDVFQVTID